jgi:hypothetical protein
MPVTRNVSLPILVPMPAASARRRTIAYMHEFERAFLPSRIVIVVRLNYLLKDHAGCLELRRSTQRTKHFNTMSNAMKLLSNIEGLQVVAASLPSPGNAQRWTRSQATQSPLGDQPSFRGLSSRRNAKELSKAGCMSSSSAATTTWLLSH